MERVILHFGCGENKVPGAIGVDKADLPAVDVRADLNCFPYPFPDNYADEIYLLCVLEHLDDIIKVMEQIWRICKPGAKVTISGPHYSSLYSWVDPTHKRPFALHTFDYFDDIYSYYSRARFRVEHRRLNYVKTNPAPRVKAFTRKIRPIIKIIQFFINLNPDLCERGWCYYVGGIDEVYIELKAIKDQRVLDTNHSNI